MHPRSGPEVSRGTARQAQRIPPRARENGGQQGGQAYSESQQQGEICHPPQDAKTVPKSRVKVNQCTPGGKIRRRAVAEEIYPTQYGVTDLRTKGTTDFEKDFFKLMNNSVFGKTMENVRNMVDIRLVNDEKKWNKLAQKHNFKSATIFSENLVAVHMKRTSIKLNKPVYLGMSILDISKTLMYDFHYNYIKPKYGENAKLLFTDTDSLCYEIKTEDFFKGHLQRCSRKVRHQQPRQKPSVRNSDRCK